MTKPTQKQLDRQKKVAKVIKRGDLAIVEHVFEVEDRLEADILEIRSDIPVVKKLLEQVRGEQGDEGTPGKDGKDGKTGPQGPQGIPGKSVVGPQGNQGVPGPMGPQGVPGRDGVTTMGPTGMPGKDGSPDTPIQIAQKLNTLRGEIDGDVIKGWADLKMNMQENLVRKEKNGFNPAMGPSFSDLRNLQTQISVLANAAGGVGTVYVETPSGVIDGANKTFTTLHTINTVFSFAISGGFLHPISDYSTAGTTITFVTAPDATLSGLPFTITYA